MCDKKVIKRHSKTIKLNIKPDWDIIYGSFNAKNPKTIYMVVQSWIKPISQNFINIFNDIENFVKDFKIKYDNLFQTRLIITFDIADSKMLLNKKSLLKIKIHLIQKECNSFLEVKEDATKIIENMINNIENISKNYFEFSQKK